MLGPKPVAVLQKNQELPSLEVTPSTASAHGHGTHSQTPGCRCSGDSEDPLLPRSPGSHRLEPRRTRRSSTACLSPCSPSTSWCSGDCPATWVPTRISLGSPGDASQSSNPQPMDLSPDPPQLPNLRRPPLGGSVPVARRPRSGPGPGVPEGG